MPKIRIKPMNGHSIRNATNGVNYVIHWTVQVFNRSIGAWIFIQAFYTERHAKNYVEQLKKTFAKGDYSCLTLRN